jgi:hypothetical protein
VLRGRLREKMIEGNEKQRKKIMIISRGGTRILDWVGALKN